jgi:outer membrane protein TolC
MNWRGLQLLISALFSLLSLFFLLIGSQRLLAAEGSRLEANELSLKQAIERALAFNPEALRAREALREGDSIFKLALSQAGPQVTGSLAYRRQKDSLLGQSRFSGQTYNLYDFQLDARQTLLERGLITTVLIGRSEQRLRRLHYEVSVRDLSYRVIQAFYRLLVLQDQLEFLRKTKKVYERNLRITQQRQQIGQSQRLDFLKLKAEVALIDPQIEEAENNLITERAFLANQLILEDFENLRLKGQLKIPAFQVLEAKINQLEKLVPEVEIIQEERSLVEKQALVQLGKHWPRVDAIGSFGRSGFEKGNLFDNDANRWAVGVQLSIPIFSSFSYFHERGRWASIERQSFQREQTVKNLNDYQRIKSIRDLKSAYAVISASQTATNLVEEALKEARRYFELARINYLELLNSEQSLLRSEISLLQAKVQFIQKLTDFFQSHGFSSAVLIEILSDQEG